MTEFYYVKSSFLVISEQRLYTCYGCDSGCELFLMCYFYLRTVNFEFGLIFLIKWINSCVEIK